MSHSLPELTPLEARILGVLVEKEKTTPDAYPLTVNSLVAGCNQKSSRDPVMSIGETDLQSCLEELRSRLLVIESYGASGRVLRYAQNFGKCYGLPQASVSLLAVLMLRGPQTVSELRANCERMYRFDDASSVEAYLEELAARSSGGLVSKLPKQPGSREHRWAHLLCGEPALPLPSADAAHPRQEETDRLAELEARVMHLEHEISELNRAVAALLPSSQVTNQ